VDIVVKGRNVEVPEHYREHVAGKLALSERLDSRVIRIDVELAHEKNPRQSDRCQRVEITCSSKGPIIRAEACAADFYAALDAAVLKLEARLRRAHDRRRISHGRHTPPSVAEATARSSTGGSRPRPTPTTRRTPWRSWTGQRRRWTTPSRSSCATRRTSPSR
jgi:ribosomal subunit interface protein